MHIARTNHSPPPAVKTIDDSPYNDCSNLTYVTFCDEIEELVTVDAMQVWWNQGAHKYSLCSYCFSVKCNISESLGLVLVKSWQANIYEMLRLIPAISTECLNAYFETVDSKINFYENLTEAPMLLEQAIPSNDHILRVLSFL